MTWQAALIDRRSGLQRAWNRMPDDIHDQILEMALERSELSPRELEGRTGWSHSLAETISVERAVTIMHEKNINKIPDAVARHWTEQLKPVAALPFAQLARLDRPIGWWLLLLPCLWSSSLAVIATGGDVIKFLHIFLFFVGAVSMRGAGCAYNDIVDREIDARVARTKFRPLPSGRITPKQAGLFTAVLCLIGFCVLLQFNRITIVTGFASLPFVVLYP